jgi:hypothetical protein
MQGDLAGTQPEFPIRRPFALSAVLPFFHPFFRSISGFFAAATPSCLP